MKIAEKAKQIKYSYLSEQFADVDDYFADLRELVKSGEFTLGPYVEKFEMKFAGYIGAKHVISTNTGTDALILALKAAGVKSGDEVITVPNTFFATVGAIVAAGARPVFIDCDERYQMDISKIEAAVNSKTRAIIPVHWAGASPDMEKIISIAARKNLKIVEDACPAVGAKLNGRFAGTFGHVNAFSMHPLKPLNVWGDGGMIATNDDKIAEYLRLYRNHGLRDRDHADFWGVNCRLQPVQAVVATRQLDMMETLVERRMEVAHLLDQGLADLRPEVKIPHRPTGNREVYQLYVVMVARRDELLRYLNERGVEAKVHYPLPLHLQKAAADLGYKKGDFPVCERQAGEILSLPAHQFIHRDEIDYMTGLIHEFYKK